MFFTNFSMEGSQGTGTQPAKAIFHPSQLKNEILKPPFDVVTSHNDQISFGKHVSGLLYIFFTCWAMCTV